MSQQYPAMNKRWRRIKNVMQRVKQINGQIRTFLSAKTSEIILAYHGILRDYGIEMNGIPLKSNTKSCTNR